VLVPLTISEPLEETPVDSIVSVPALFRLPLTVSACPALMVREAPALMVRLLHSASAGITGWFNGYAVMVTSVEAVGTPQHQFVASFHSLLVVPNHVVVVGVGLIGTAVSDQ